MPAAKQTDILKVSLTIVLLLLFFGPFVMLFVSGRWQRGCPARLENDTRLRGIQQALVTYASTNNTFYPGRNSDGSDGQLTVEARYTLLVRQGYFRPEFLISPKDKVHKPAAQGAPISAANYSFAMLQVPPQGQRRGEWQDTSNTDAAVLCDRDMSNGGQSGGSPRESIHARGKWAGQVAWNDNHVNFEQTQRGGECVLFSSKYGPAAFRDDELWTLRADPADPGGEPAKPEDNCLMVNSGN